MAINGDSTPTLRLVSAPEPEAPPARPYDERMAELIAATNARADKLVHEFREYTADALAVAPELDHTTILESWVIQKLAFLQVLAERHNDSVNSLVLRRKSLRKPKSGH